MMPEAQDATPRFFQSIPDLTTRLRNESGVLVFDGLRNDLLPQLQEDILQIAQTSRDSYPSRNIGGWKSNEQVFDATHALQELRADLMQWFFAGRRPTGWAMINRGGSEHPRHQHRMAAISGVYYITPGDPATPTIIETGGGTGFTRVPVRSAPKNEVTIEPVPGRLVLFLGEIWHRVPRYDGTEPRITIAFDVKR